MEVEREWVVPQVEVKMNGEIMEVVKTFKYIRRCFRKDGGPQDDFITSLSERLKTDGAMKTMLNFKKVSLGVRRKL